MTIAADNYPILPNCENKVSKKCFVELLNNEVQKHFTNELAEKLGLSEGKSRIYIRFELDNIGNINNIYVRAPHPKFEEIGISIIENIPKMKPYLKNNKPSHLKFNLSISYIVE